MDLILKIKVNGFHVLEQNMAIIFGKEIRKYKMGIV